MLDYTEGMGIGSSEKWMPVLVRKLEQIRNEQELALSQINDISLCDPVVLAGNYVEPDCQEIEPALHRAEDEMVAKQPIFEKIDQYFKQPIHYQGSTHLFILADAGMGKSALLAMLKLMHLSGFWPQYSECVLKKLGSGTLEQIQQLDPKRKTILLLDALDEDPKAHDRLKKRLLDILKSTQTHSKVVITCRSRVFRNIDEHTTETAGRVSIGPFRCYSKYLSFFNNQKVYQYLSKRFPKRFLGIGFNQKKRDDAQSIIAKMGTLRCRPLLLNCVDDLIRARSLEDGDISEYRVCNGLFDSWLRRVCTINKEIATRDLRDACIILAVWMQIHKKSHVSRVEMDELVEKITGLKPITQMGIMTNGSLLNKNSDGNYRFLHNSIQEFCVAKYLSEKPAIKLEGVISINKKIGEMIMASGTINPHFGPESLHLIQFDHAVKEVKTVKRYGMELVYVPPGLFKMGSPEQELGREPHESHHPVVLLEGFYMQTTPLTQGQWKSVMKGENPSKHNGDGNRPVEQVSWHDAHAFIRKLNYLEGRRVFDLPTEAQWEYACRAGSTTRYNTGNAEADLDKAGWYKENSNEQAHSVAQKEPNSFGLYDMHGNVIEWVQDHWHDDYQGAPPDGSAWVDSTENAYRIVRGGCWSFDANECRSAFRGGYKARNRSGFVGFRLVMHTDQWAAIKDK